MDKTAAFEAVDGGSIPSGRTSRSITHKRDAFVLVERVRFLSHGCASDRYIPERWAVEVAEVQRANSLVKNMISGYFTVFSAYSLGHKKGK